MSVTLVIMAAGLGSRFGGDKQLVSVGPNGEAFFDYAISDALGAGATDVTLIVRSSIEEQVLDHVGRQHPGLAVATICQDRHGPQRAKPWGTAHAVLAAAPAIAGPFVVVNADDYYGPSSYRQVVGYLAGAGADQGAIVGFELARTLPSVGSVSRGICHSDEGGRLAGIIETHGISRSADGTIRSDDPSGEHADETLVSMNMWGLPHKLLDRLESQFDEFLTEHGNEEKSEFLLPTAVSELMADGEISIEVLRTDENWIGVTNPDDLEVARTLLSDRS